jgi:preprotein translocase subunit SecG
MMTFITVIHISAIVLLVISVLLQSGKGAEISATFGGSSQTVFGSSGGQNFFQKLTYTLAGIFMVTSLILTILPGKTKKSVFEGYTPPAASVPVTAPVTTPAGAPATATAPATAPSAAAATVPAAEQKK